MAIKNTVYILPKREETIEDFQWLLKEIQREGGEGVVCDAGLVEGLADADIIRLFNAQSDASYANLSRQARKLLNQMKAGPNAGKDTRRWEAESAKLRKNLQRIAEHDFFKVKGGHTARSILGDVDRRLAAVSEQEANTMTLKGTTESFAGRTWVTRANIFVDRMASAWLIKRFIDTSARFKFVDAETYRPRPNELRFDTYEGEFTHRGDQCTFEVLCDAFKLHEPALAQLAEIIHDIDLKDAKYAREEAAGIALVLRGIRATFRTDIERLGKAKEVFDTLYQELKPRAETKAHDPGDRKETGKPGKRR
ncbi:MAG: chromate resistance protein [Candidatus Hydrogenedentes bacterium]|nr:chromate resistance protein [Candidatus Hydrogenedentota bacterium]